MLELPFLAIFATCTLGMIKLSSKKRVKLPIGKREIETQVEGFLAKLKRTSTRTSKCRLISSVERIDFQDDWHAVDWQFVRFEDKEGEIFDKKKS